MCLGVLSAGRHVRELSDARGLIPGVCAKGGRAVLAYGTALCGVCAWASRAFVRRQPVCVYSRVCVVGIRRKDVSVCVP